MTRVPQPNTISSFQVPIFITKTIELYEMICVRHGLMVVGPTGGGKSCNIAVLKEALTHLKVRVCTWTSGGAGTSSCSVAVFFGQLERDRQLGFTSAPDTDLISISDGGEQSFRISKWKESLAYARFEVSSHIFVAWH